MIGKGIVDRLAAEFPLEVEWSGYELHPETPLGGISVAEHLRGMDLGRMYSELAVRAAEFSLIIRPSSRMPNTRVALHAAEYARDQGCFDQFHTLLFRAHFENLLDIEAPLVLRALAEEVGLDPDDMMKAVADNRYGSRLARVREDARGFGLTGVPLFVMKWPGARASIKVVGARPLDDFRRLLKDER